MHSAWNFNISVIIGVQASGLNMPSIFETTGKGKSIFTGGEFGFEGGLVLTGLLIILCTLGVYITFLKLVK